MTLRVILLDPTNESLHVWDINLEKKDKTTPKDPFIRNQSLLWISSDKTLIIFKFYYM